MATVTGLHTNLSQFHLSHDLVPAHYRRLSDKVLVVFHHSCDAFDLEAAEHLFVLLERMTVRPPRPGAPDRRLVLTHLVDAHERLITLRRDRPR